MRLQQHQGFALWLTGRPASGKSCVARRTAELLQERGVPVHVMDADELRRAFGPEPYDDAKSQWFYEFMAFSGRLLTRRGVNVLFVATAPRRQYRDLARDEIERFAEVYVRCAPEVCRCRDAKGVYPRAPQSGSADIADDPVPYEPPQQAELVVDTERHNVDACAGRILSFLHICGWDRAAARDAQSLQPRAAEIARPALAPSAV